MTTILFIHGINNQNNSKDNIEKTWSAALRENSAHLGFKIPDSIRFSAAFYGDILFTEAENWGANEKPIQPMSTDSSSQDYVDREIAELYLEFQKAYNIDDTLISSSLDNDDLINHRRMANGIHKKWIKAIARTLEKILPTKGKFTAGFFLKQASAYLHKPGLKERIDDLVMAQIFSDLPENENIIVVSHSLGTVIAYSLMHRLRHQVKATLLLTAGSPLGIEIVKRRLGPPLICLPNVGEWLNISDTEDFVALKPELNGDTFGCQNIINITNIDNGDEDAHDALQYLSHPVVAERILSKISVHDSFPNERFSAPT